MACIIVYPKEFAQTIKTILHTENIGELVMPADLSDKPMTESVKIILQQNASLSSEILELESTLHQLACEIFNKLTACSSIIAQKLEQIRVLSELYGTKSTFFLYGWLPDNEIRHFIKSLNERFPNLVVVDVVSVSAEESENIPVSLNNPRLIKPFEVLTRFLALPKYGTFDPSPLLAIFFPVFFGLMLGDMGYGIIAFMGSIWAVWRWRKNELVRDTIAHLRVGSNRKIWSLWTPNHWLRQNGELIGIHP